MVDPVLIPIIAIASLPVLAVGVPIARAYANRLESAPAPHGLAPELSARIGARMIARRSLR